ncbi:Vacuolar protein sorting-associated protein 16 [Vanrija albida]|uniref:Probable vacuolar protein sorting-associated protein 16 homolog n=1 Tax=Vanrija albida TaxID=181172 RepID=A0ABR3Q8X0_9TREE
MAYTVSPTATWDTIEDVFYRKEEVYQMAWNVPDLSDYLVAVSRNGGPIALMRDERKVLLQSRHTGGKPKIQVYASSGRLIATFTWELSPPILLQFTGTHLVVLSDEGTYRLYDLSSPGEYTQHTLGSEVADLGVVSARAWEDGLVVLTGGLQFVETRGWKGGRVSQLVDSGLSEAPHSWAVIPPEYSASGHVEVLVSTGSTVVTLDALERVDQRISRGPFSHIALSPNGRFLALVTATGMLWVVSSDFARNLSEVDISQFAGSGTDLHGLPDRLPERVKWCGDNAVVLSWGGRVVIVGPKGESIQYDHPPAAVIVGEVDSLRIISSATCEVLQKVPDALLAVFRPGSDHPAAVLYDALDHFERKSPKADEAIRSIRPDLARAVDTCIEAAGQEWEVTWQRRLLKAAQFGRAFLDLYNPNDFVTMAQTLKVLNAVRYYEVGIPITYQQYIAAGAPALISRLLTRNEHVLALRISQHLGLRPDPVLKHWAAARITRAKGDPRDTDGDAALCDAIVSKFEKEGEKDVSYSDIAQKAYENGRVRLATMLLDHESRAAEQVPLLLRMKQDKIALEKAVGSGDTDLVYHVLLRLHSSLSPGEFFAVLDDSLSPQLTPAVKLLQVYAKENDRQLLRDFYYQDDRRTENATLEMEEAGTSAVAEERIEHLKQAAKFFAEDKARGFEAKMADEAQRLLAVQLQYERETDHKFDFAGLTVDAFISELLIEGLGKRADRIRADWKVPDKRWWWLKLKALAKTHNWEGIETFAKSKKSPIGYEPFVTHLLSLDPPQPLHAASYVPRCDAKARPDLYAKCGQWGKAAESAKERGDKDKLEEIRRSAPPGLPQREVEEVIRRPK